jgi:hypothetical protein
MNVHFLYFAAQNVKCGESAQQSSSLRMILAIERQNKRQPRKIPPQSAHAGQFNLSGQSQPMPPYCGSIFATRTYPAQAFSSLRNSA